MLPVAPYRAAAERRIPPVVRKPVARRITLRMAAGARTEPLATLALPEPAPAPAPATAADVAAGLLAPEVELMEPGSASLSDSACPSCDGGDDATAAAHGLRASANDSEREGAGRR